MTPSMERQKSSIEIGKGIKQVDTSGLAKEVKREAEAILGVLDTSWSVLSLYLRNYCAKTGTVAWSQNGSWNIFVRDVGGRIQIKKNWNDGDDWYERMVFETNKSGEITTFELGDWVKLLAATRIGYQKIVEEKIEEYRKSMLREKGE